MTTTRSTTASSSSARMDTVWTAMDSILALPGDGGEATLLEGADAGGALDELESAANRTSETRTFTTLREKMKDR